MTFSTWEEVVFKECNHRRVYQSNQHQIIFPLEIPTEEDIMKERPKDFGKISVQGLINKFSDCSCLESSPRFCSDCKKDMEIKNQAYSFDDISPNFMIHLKRFELNSDNALKKTHTQVNVDEVLHIQKKYFYRKQMVVRERGDAVKYFLSAVVCHEGEEISSGHYTTFIVEYATSEDIREGNAIYHYLDDDKHCMVPKEDFDAYVSRKAYAVLYKQVATNLELHKNRSLNEWKLHVLQHLETFIKKHQMKPPNRKSSRQGKKTKRSTIEGYFDYSKSDKDENSKKRRL